MLLDRQGESRVLTPPCRHPCLTGLSGTSMCPAYNTLNSPWLSTSGITSCRSNRCQYHGRSIHSVPVKVSHFGVNFSVSGSGRGKPSRISQDAFMRLGFPDVFKRGLSESQFFCALFAQKNGRVPQQSGKPKRMRPIRGGFPLPGPRCGSEALRRPKTSTNTPKKVNVCCWH